MQKIERERERKGVSEREACLIRSYHGEEESRSWGLVSGGKPIQQKLGDLLGHLNLFRSVDRGF